MLYREYPNGNVMYCVRVYENEGYRDIERFLDDDDIHAMGEYCPTGIVKKDVIDGILKGRSFSDAIQDETTRLEIITKSLLVCDSSDDIIFAEHGEGALLEKIIYHYFDNVLFQNSVLQRTDFPHASLVRLPNGNSYLSSTLHSKLTDIEFSFEAMECFVNDMPEYEDTHCLLLRSIEAYFDKEQP